jgi:hypothetical protein
MGSRSLQIRTVAVAFLVLATGLAACGASASGTTSSAAKVSCGRAAPEVLARAAGLVATRIYAAELASSETHSDQHEVESYAPLLTAVLSGETAAVKAAVTSLVYSGTHIVRLRVTKGSTLLADVGGPYIIAPISGSLRLRGRTIGHYVLSVQDDLGYVKLETRFIGAPLVMRAGSHGIPVEGLVSPGPASIPEHGPVDYRHVSYQAFSFSARAFPDGPLRISLLLQLPASLTSETCAEVTREEMGLVAQRISRRFALSPGDFDAYIKLTQTLTGGLVYIRSPSGSRLLAGSTRSAPASLPPSGPLKYRGTSYEVASFEAPSSAGAVRVYVLIAA